MYVIDELKLNEFKEKVCISKRDLFSSTDNPQQEFFQNPMTDMPNQESRSDSPNYAFSKVQAIAVGGNLLDKEIDDEK